MTHIAEGAEDAGRGARGGRPLRDSHPPRSPTTTVALRPGTGRRARLRHHARALRRGLCGPRLPRPATPIILQELEAHLASRDPAWASAITGIPAAEIISPRPHDRPRQAHLHPLGLRLHALAQRRRQHARRHLHRRRHRRLAARGRRRDAHQQERLRRRRHPDRGARRPRPLGADARHVAHRRRADRRSARPRRRPARHRHRHAERQSPRRSRPNRRRCARASCGTISSSRCTSSS